MPSEKRDGFVVVNPGQSDCSFKILDRGLKRRIMRTDRFHEAEVSVSLISLLAERSERIDLDFIEVEVQEEDGIQDPAPAAEADEGTEKPAAEAPKRYQPAVDFINAVRQQRDQLKERAKAIKPEGRASFLGLLYAFEKHEPIVTELSAGVRQGGLIESASLGISMFGPYVSVRFRFVSFNGTKFVYTIGQRTIPPFEGELEFSALPLQPMSAEDKSALAERGQKYVKLNTVREQVQHSGAMLRRSYFGERLYPADGRVMVDMKSFIKLDPNYADNFFGDPVSSRSSEEVNISDQLSLACCPPYLYGFSFAAKIWGEMNIDALSPVVYRKDAFERVVMEPERKRIVKALVSADMSEFSDIIDGKSGGVIFLLAGPPGVGKTLTAEGIAETLEKPLYVVSAGELGIKPEEVEEKLRQILDMATIWNAVLLLDECDIFMEKRSKKDLKRNALVAVFLRMLEYYSGVLFLTTNRASNLDKAVLSRISLALSYSDLDYEKRLKVWQGLAQGHKFNKLDFESLAKHPLNGREIKHCLRLALALAKHEERKATQEDVELMVNFSKDFRRAEKTK